MISLTSFDDHIPELPKELLEIEAKLRALAVHDWTKAKEVLWKHALKFNNGGTMPDEATMREMGQEVTDPNGKHLLLWGHPPLKPGDQIDMDYCIADIDPPEHFTS